MKRLFIVLALIGGFIIGLGTAALATHTSVVEQHVIPFTIGNVTGAVTITDTDALPHETVTVTVTEPSSPTICDRTASPGVGTAQTLADSLVPGQTGCLRTGTYIAASSHVIRFATGGSPGNPIRIRSFPGERARIAGSVYVTQTADQVSISDLDIVGPNGNSVIFVNADDTIIERNDITNEHRGRSCLILGSPDTYGRAVRTIIRDNRIHHCGQIGSNLDHGIYAGYSNNSQILRNIFYSSGAYSVQVYPDAQGTQLIENIMDGGSPSIRGGIVLGSEGGRTSSNTLIERNIIAFAVTYNVDWYWGGPVGSGNIARNNCLWAGGQGNIRGGSSPTGITVTGTVVADPLFVDRPNRNYTLGENSQCRTVFG